MDFSTTAHESLQGSVISAKAAQAPPLLRQRLPPPFCWTASPCPVQQHAQLSTTTSIHLHPGL
eukprot:scaffold85772_cov22-Tisochrysis_lutea.AAC.4